jgi:hypothetical protein
MKTSTDREPLYVKYGEVVFAIDGVPLKLNIYKNIELKKQKNTKLFVLPFQILLREWKLLWKYIDLTYAKREYYCYRFQ